MDPVLQFPGQPVASPATDTPVRTKPPLRVVRSDDFTQTLDGKVYYPHAGETVSFVSSIRLDTLMMAMRLQGIQGLDMGNLSREDAADFKSMFGDICAELAECIRDWTWTGDDVDEAGNFVRLPWAKGPGAREANRATLGGRTMDEVMWLVGAAFGGGVSGESAGNATGA